MPGVVCESVVSNKVIRIVKLTFNLRQTMSFLQLNNLASSSEYSGWSAWWGCTAIFLSILFVYNDLFWCNIFQA